MFIENVQFPYLDISDKPAEIKVFWMYPLLIWSLLRLKQLKHDQKLHFVIFYGRNSTFDMFIFSFFPLPHAKYHSRHKQVHFAKTENHLILSGK